MGSYLLHVAKIFLKGRKPKINKFVLYCPKEQKQNIERGSPMQCACLSLARLAAGAVGITASFWLGSVSSAGGSGVSAPLHPSPRSLKLAPCPPCFNEIPKHCAFSPGHLLLCSTHPEGERCPVVCSWFWAAPGLVGEEVQLKLPVFGSHSQMLHAFLWHPFTCRKDSRVQLSVALHEGRKDSCGWC